jgi:hypothetical protein
MNSIYLNADNGNDVMARLSDPSAPAKTLDAALGLLNTALVAGRKVTIYGREGDSYSATARTAGSISFVGGTYDLTLIAGTWTINSVPQTSLTLQTIAAATLNVYGGGGVVDLRGTVGNVNIYGARFTSDSLTIPSTKLLFLRACTNATVGVTTSAGTIKAVNSDFVTFDVAAQTTGGTCVLYNCVVEETFEVNGQTISAIGCVRIAMAGTATLTATGSTTI